MKAVALSQGRVAGACPDPGRQPGSEAMGNKHSALFPASLPNPQTVMGEQVNSLTSVLRADAVPASSSKENLST